jgi:hypothetical protein
MNSATNTLNLPLLTADLFEQANLNIDNTFNLTWKSIGFNIMLRQAKFSKRSGKPAWDVVYLLMLCVDALGLAKSGLCWYVFKRCFIKFFRNKKKRLI